MRILKDRVSAKFLCLAFSLLIVATLIGWFITQNSEGLAVYLVIGICSLCLAIINFIYIALINNVFEKLNNK